MICATLVRGILQKRQEDQIILYFKRYDTYSEKSYGNYKTEELMKGFRSGSLMYANLAMLNLSHILDYSRGFSVDSKQYETDFNKVMLDFRESGDKFIEIADIYSQLFLGKVDTEHDFKIFKNYVMAVRTEIYAKNNNTAEIKRLFEDKNIKVRGDLRLIQESLE